MALLSLSIIFISNMNKTFAAPSIIHSEKGNSFHEFFKETSYKVARSLNRVMVVTSPYATTREYFDNYDNINWKSARKTKIKML